uniref:Bifunctional inhibitor/plant lipid transfer protein/seed storage helical domain-containing protein n=1 Tax=Oryza meridionalis TaxID=40149 RepID=A0A0E0DI90_9ORYZ
MAAAAAKNGRNAVAALLLAALALSAQLAPAAACSYCPTPKPPPPPPPAPSGVPCPPPPYTPTPATPTPSTPTGKCPVNTLKLLACVDALNGLVHAVVGAKASDTCCPLLSGVADLDAALCLCTAIKAKALGVSLVLPVAISVLVNECGKHVPSSFQCPS